MDPLEQLRDIHLPEAIPWWPPAPGWWLLALLIIVLCTFFIRSLKVRQRANQYRKEALHELRLITASNTTLEANEHIANLVRRVAKTAFPQRHSEALPTEKMLAELNRYCTPPPFSADLITELQQALYQQGTGEKEQLARRFTAAAETWIKKHKRAQHEKQEVSTLC